MHLVNEVGGKKGGEKKSECLGLGAGMKWPPAMECILW